MHLFLFHVAMLATKPAESVFLTELFSKFIILSISSVPWFENKRIGKGNIGKLLPGLCKIADVPILTNHSIRPTSVRAMKRGGFDYGQVAFISGHKSIDNLKRYDALTVLDKTKMALALQQGPATLDGNQVDLDSLARVGQKRKNEEPVASTSKKVTFDEEDVVEACDTEFIFADNEDSGLGTSEITEEHYELPADVENLKSDVSEDLPEQAIPSSQGHNVAQLIRDQMNMSKELINNYISALKKK